MEQKLIEQKPIKQKLFSIIVPVFNPGIKIEKTIKSVLSQDRDLFEFIIVDGDSDDGSLDTMEKYDDKITIVSEHDENVYDAMNKGIDLSTGKYLYFLGAGDALKPDILTQIQHLLPREEELIFVYGNVYMIERGVVYDGKFDRRKLKKRNICHQAIFYERAIFDVVGMYEPRFRILADYAHNMKCFRSDLVQKKYIAYVIANFEGGGISETRRDIEFAEEYAEIMSIGEQWKD